jgi:hypothetical protein
MVAAALKVDPKGISGKHRKGAATSPESADSSKGNVADGN